jgi:FkbM family methyltransferase
MFMFNDHVKSTFRSLGFDLRRFNPANSEAAQLKAMLAVNRINIIFDVGANTGQFGRVLRSVGYRGKIVSFEPLVNAHEQLLKASRGDPLWEVATRGAIGSEEGEIEIHVAGNSQSSSVLGMLDAHSDAAPESRYLDKEKVPLYRLDSLLPSYLSQDMVPFLKIDTQGYEDRVIKGAKGVLSQITGLQLEMSLVPLYEGQKLYPEMMEVVSAAGFKLWSMSQVFVDPHTGRLLQVDATFFR